MRRLTEISSDLKLLAVSFFVLFLVYVTNSHAQEKPVQKPTIELICGTEQQFKDSIIGYYKETPLISFSTMRIIQGQEIHLVSMLFVNQETMTWTLVERWSSDIYCVVAAGTGFEPYSNPKNNI